jgi:hypothetical protein
MVEFLHSLQPGYLIAIILGLIIVIRGAIDVSVFFFQDYWNARKVQAEKRDRALQANTTAIMKLELRMEQLTDLLTIVPKLKADVDSAHEHIRDLKKTLRD